MSQEFDVEIGKPGILTIGFKNQEPGCKVERRDQNLMVSVINSILYYGSMYRSNGLTPRHLIGARSIHQK